MASKDWIMVRIQRATRLLLDRFAKKLQNARERGQNDRIDVSDRWGVSLDEAIRELLRRDEDHAARSQRSIDPAARSGKKRKQIGKSAADRPE